jgi:hypothetical protein
MPTPINSRLLMSGILPDLSNVSFEAAGDRTRLFNVCDDRSAPTRC